MENKLALYIYIKVHISCDSRGTCIDSVCTKMFIVAFCNSERDLVKLVVHSYNEMPGRSLKERDISVLLIRKDV